MPAEDYYTYVYVSGSLRPLLHVLWNSLEGDKPPSPASFINNGCTFSPDSVHGKKIWPACVVHDWNYRADSAVSRRDADAQLRRNIGFLLKAQGVNPISAWLIAFSYWRAVRRAGRPFYSGKGDPK